MTANTKRNSTLSSDKEHLDLQKTDFELFVEKHEALDEETAAAAIGGTGNSAAECVPECGVGTFRG